MNLLFTYTASKSSVKRLVRHALSRHPQSTVGHAVCKQYEVPPELRSRIIESDSFLEVSDHIHQFVIDRV